MHNFAKLYEKSMFAKYGRFTCENVHSDDQ